MFDPPSGDADLGADAEDAVVRAPRYREFVVEKLGLTLEARRPDPRAAHALAMAANSKIGAQGQADHLTLFIRHHVSDESYRTILERTMLGDLPSDSLTEVARALATWGTARPTVP
ncbi:hypothetical protein FDJ57_gp37 [Gordonia phage Sour]|uniref:Uncharacterized protein n=1 Tax=Gordonia phage Sour TaxID=2182349 RepID=A0A2U8UKW9_9CAUD|nr:hypothetical protein FDJ57_gp37 [Gordonia phage Sour]AWN04238.1 hypothetical protein PBI_SOUR_37 [Gordonia phage Sour]